MCPWAGVYRYIFLLRDDLPSAPVQTATMSHCIELARQVSDSRHKVQSIERKCFRSVFIVGSLSFVFARRNTESRGERARSRSLDFPVQWNFRYAAIVPHANVYVNFHHAVPIWRSVLAGSPQAVLCGICSRWRCRCCQTTWEDVREFQRRNK